MKRLTTFLLALMLAWIGANAQTDFSWAFNVGTWTGNTGTYDGGMEHYQDGSSGGACTAGKILYQNIEGLPAGEYTLMFDAVANMAWNSYATGSNIAQVYVIANGTTQIEDVTVYDQTGCTLSDYPHTFTVTVGSDGTLEYGLQNIATGGNWYIAQGVSLTYNGTYVPTAGDKVYGCTAEFDHWSIAGNSGGSFQRNTWSTEGETSGMVTPFIEYWVGGSNNLSDATISHTQIANLPEGYYTVSIDARAFNEADETPVTTGTVLYYAKGDGDSQNVSVDLATGTDNLFNGHFEYYGTYSVIANVSTAGTLDVGFTISGTNSDWLSFKNLSVTYLGEELTYSIGAPQCSLDGKYVQPSSEVSITFPNCITPTTGETPTLSTTASITVGSTAVTVAILSYSGTTATVTFSMPESVGYGETVTVSVPAGLLSWSGTSVSSAAAEFTLTTPLIEDQTGVYLFNLGENEFLSRGHNYNDTNGTASDVDVYGLPVDITANADGKYNIRYIDSNLYLGGEYWATANVALAAAASFTLVEDGTADDGKTIYRFRNGSSNSTVTGDLYVNSGTSHGPLGLNDDDNGVNSDADRQWVIYSKAERDAFKEANVLAAKLATAQALDPSFSGTTETEFDEFIGNLKYETLTNMVGGASLSTETDLTYWTEDDYSTEGAGFAAGEGVIETYEDVDDLTQTITGLEEGIYKVTLQGYNRMGAASYILANLADYDISLATLGANDDEINLKTWASDREKMSSSSNYSDAYPSSMAHAAECFTADLYNNELYTYVSNGSLTITIACPDFLGADWVVFTNLTLTRYYTDDIYTNDVTWKLANPSFEVDNVVANLTEDETRTAYKVTSLTGWTLTPPNNTDSARPVSDLMTSSASETDNDYGVPGTPSDGTYMLYLRNSWTSGTETASVLQSVTLPEGDYKLTVDTKCVSSGSYTSALLVAGDHSVNLTVHDKQSTTKEDPFLDAWDTPSITFTSDGETEITLGVTIAYANATDGLSVLLDNFKLYSAEEIEESISWEMTEVGWGTMILPFDATLEEGLTAYSCSGTEESEDEEGNEITVVSLTEVGQSIAANTPYIIEGTTGTYSFSGVPTPAEDGTYKETYTAGILTGTLVDLAIEKGAALTIDGTNYVLQNHEGENGEEGEGLAFYPITSSSTGVTLDAYHCYLTISSGVSPTALHLPGMSTGIVAVEGTETLANDAIYDLSGRRVAKAVKGVYIQNGKKVLVK